MQNNLRNYVPSDEKLSSSEYKDKSISRNISAGAIAGLVGGIIMIPFFLIPGIFNGIEHTMLLFEVIGNAFGVIDNTAAVVGVIAHLITSVLVGIIFGIIIDKIKKFELTSVRKSIGIGLVAGMVVFVTLILPIFGVLLPPALIQNAVHTYHVTTQQATVYYQEEGFSKSMIFGLIQNLVYGIVLSLVTRTLANRSLSHGMIQK